MSLAATTVKLDVVGGQTEALNVQSGTVPIDFEARYDLADGTGANQAKSIWSDKRTLAASASESLDLNGVLTDAFGAVINFTKIKALIVKADAGNTNDVQLGDAASNALASIFGATGVVNVKPGGCVAFVAPDANGYAVTAGTADLLKVANSGGGTGVTYTIIVIGV